MVRMARQGWQSRRMAGQGWHIKNGRGGGWCDKDGTAGREDGMTRMAGQRWQGGRMSQQGWQGRRMAGHGVAPGERSRLPVHSSCQRCCLHPPSPSLFLMAQMVLTLSWAFFSIINSCLQVGRHFFPFGRAIKLSSAVCFFKAIAYLSPNCSLLFLPGSFKALGCPPFSPPLALARR